MKCDKYITISELKNKINTKENLNYKKNDILIFCGQLMKNNMRLIDYQINKYKDEYLYYIISNEENERVFNIAFNNIKSKIYVCDYFDLNSLYHQLKKYISIYFKIPIQNQILYFNDQYLEPNNLDDYYMAFLQINLATIELKFISDLEYVTIYINYKENKWELKVNRYSNKWDILYYLSEKYPFTYNDENDYPILKFNEKKIDIINESNIIGGENLYLTLSSSLKSIYKKKKNKVSYTITIKTLTKKELPIEVWDDLTINDLKLIVTAIEDIPVDNQRMVFESKQLENEKTIKYYNIKKGSIIHLVLRLSG